MEVKKHLTPRHFIREGTLLLGNSRLCEILLSELLEVNRTALYLDEQPLSEEISDRFFDGIEGLKRGEPLQYLIGKATFMEETFRVTPDCFIPRPATETLVEACLDYFHEVQSTKYKVRPLLFIDIGTGSGCIAISLTKRGILSTILAIDLRQEALQVAQGNGHLHGVSQRISWLCGDLFEPLKKGKVEADAILSNPPYIPTQEISFLPPEVLHEPRVSLDGGEDGLHFYRRIAEEGPPFLKEGGALFLEIGEHQERPVKSLFLEKGFRCLEARKDLQEFPRVMVFRKERHG
ncbi:MAG: peptide chain release factor N(5)-glutamine methyltransferase [Candidatus Omnitrophica bacterium]|nr:peptide chain release factor N(5)-glutamine methyltransferase [Candidatus Omnitrophota bacterium]